MKYKYYDYEYIETIKEYEIYHHYNGKYIDPNKNVIKYVNKLNIPIINDYIDNILIKIKYKDIDKNNFNIHNAIDSIKIIKGNIIMNEWLTIRKSDIITSIIPDYTYNNNELIINIIPTNGFINLSEYILHNCKLEIILLNSYCIEESICSIRFFSKKTEKIKKFKYLFYLIKFKNKFRDWLWIKVREPKIKKNMHPNIIKNILLNNDIENIDFDNIIS